MGVWGLWMWGPWCWACWTCGDVPDWPANGEANARWVREAIAWRMNVGLDDCPDVVPALDAWTLEWLSESEDIHVTLKTAEWPFLAYAPELQTVLIQRLALDGLSFQSSTQMEVLKDVRNVARRTDALWDDALKRAFDNAEGLAQRRDRAQAKDAEGE
ncbi:MAG: hypothetical protein VYA72_03875 [Bacteroidota bacterium]|nr:hypothetical protein [Bacteroidota bacterium]